YHKSARVGVRRSWGSGLLRNSTLLAVDPGGVAAGSRWWRVVCDTTGTSELQANPRGVPDRKSKALVPLRGTILLSECPVVSQNTLNHRLQAVIPPGSKPVQSPPRGDPYPL